MYVRSFRGSHRDRLDRLERYSTFISLHNSTSFAKTLQSDQSTVIDLIDDCISFTDNEESEESRIINLEEKKNKLELNLQLNYGSSCGLYNPGQNICFMNAVIQTLINLPYITPCLLNGIHKANCKLRTKSIFCSLCLLESLTQKAHSVKGPVNNPFFSITKKAIWNKYIPGKQQDSHEFLRYLVESFSTPIGTKSTPDSYKKNLIGQAFHGTLKSIVKCRQCKYSSEKLENFLDIALDITKDALENCIIEFIKPQQLTGSNKYHCPKCKNKRDATISLNFGKLPIILCIALKRFNFGVFGLEKTLKSLKYPQFMNLNDKNYELSALVCHLGHSLYSGHYIAYAKGGHGFWNKFDDSRVSISDKHHVLEQNKTAYLLFYVQQNISNFDLLLNNNDNQPVILNRKKNNINNINNKKNDVFNPFSRINTNNDLSNSYGLHQISTWDGKDQDREDIKKHNEKLIPRIAKVDECDREYDRGKLKKIKSKKIFKGKTEVISKGKKQLIITGKTDFDNIKNKVGIIPSHNKRYNRGKNNNSKKGINN